MLAGPVRSRLGDGPTVDYRPGRSRVEPPGTLHSLTPNPSPTRAASLLAGRVSEDGAAPLIPP